jgi:hypothetical protein
LLKENNEVNTNAQPWQPTIIRRFVKALPTSACTVIVETDAGKGYLKALGNNEGPNILACEWVGTRLANWFGLPTFDFAQIDVTDIDEIPFHNGNMAQAGKAFITRSESGETWGGQVRQLGLLFNPQNITRLVVFDTWTLNCDRFSHPVGASKPRVNYGNVFLSEEAPEARLLLKAMDHTHCFSCGHALTKQLSNIDVVRDERIFGLFPEFRSLVTRDGVEDAVADLRRMNRTIAEQLTDGIPNEWQVSAAARQAMIDLIVGRAHYLADTIEDRFRSNGLIWEQPQIGFDEA